MAVFGRTECGRVFVAYDLNEPVSKKVERLEKKSEANRAYAATLEKDLADAKAKLAAEAEAKKPKTVGEEVAASLVQNYGDPPYGGVCPNSIHFRTVNGYGGRTLVPIPKSDDRDEVADFIRQQFAAAIDKAVADARAEQREKDAKLIEQRSEIWAESFPYNGRVVRLNLGWYAESIRKNK